MLQSPTRISLLWGVHLTGVRSSPRPVLPRALETGRMSAFPRWRGPHGLGTFLARQVLVAHGVMGDGELQDPVKQQPAATGTSAGKAGHELLEVAGQVRRVQRSLVW